MQRRSVIALGLLGAAFPVAALAGSKGWRTLFDGKSLKGWTPLGDANWALKDGVAQADNGKTGFLVSDETFGDVEIRAEFWASDDANSGIFIRCTNPLKIGTASGYEVNIYDQRPEPAYGTGAIVGVAKVSPMPKAGGRWNVMEIVAKGDRFTVTFNGARTVDGVQNADFAHGRIALQYGLGVVKFRKVQVREI
ncbi:MAG: 3-keto-disaccharide hydrolase [Phenylobacterium sp.]